MGYSKIVSGNKCVVTKYGELGPNHNEIVIFSGTLDEYKQWVQKYFSFYLVV